MSEAVLQVKLGHVRCVFGFSEGFPLHAWLGLLACLGHFAVFPFLSHSGSGSISPPQKLLPLKT